MTTTAWRDVLLVDYRQHWQKGQSGPVEAFATPFDDLNKSCGDAGGRIGLARGWFITVGGNPGAGKSLLALNLAVSALRAGQCVAFLSLEMAPEQITTRLYSIITGIPVRQLERGEAFDPLNYGERIEQFIMHECGPRAGLWLNQDPLHDIEDVMRELDDVVSGRASEFPATVVFVDYLQLVGVGSEDSITAATTEIATRLRLLAHQRKVTLIGLSQFNRSTSANREQTPVAQGLYGGMALEANSDLVLLQDHSRYQIDEDRPNIARTWLVVDKNRHGRRIEIPVWWDYETLTINQAAPHEEDLWPTHKNRR